MEAAYYGSVLHHRRYMQVTDTVKTEQMGDEPGTGTRARDSHHATDPDLRRRLFLLAVGVLGSDGGVRTARWRREAFALTPATGDTMANRQRDLTWVEQRCWTG